MAEHIGSEIGISQAWYPVAAVIGIIGMVPGMPTALFLTFATGSAAVGYYLSRAGRDEEEYGDSTNELTFDEEDDDGIVTADEIADNSRISVILSYPLISLVEDEIMAS
jgi:flagellar biosynthesis protein FlhA